jgi:hypothetical protein
MVDGVLDIIYGSWRPTPLPLGGMNLHVAQEMGVVLPGTHRHNVLSQRQQAVYKHSSAARVWSRQEYKHVGYIDQISQGCVPVGVLILPEGRINRRGFGPPLANL